jgi:hypothetical protein
MEKETNERLGEIFRAERMMFGERKQRIKSAQEIHQRQQLDEREKLVSEMNISLARANTSLFLALSESVIAETVNTCASDFLVKAGANWFRYGEKILIIFTIGRYSVAVMRKIAPREALVEKPKQSETSLVDSKIKLAHSSFSLFEGTMEDSEKALTAQNSCLAVVETKDEQPYGRFFEITNSPERIKDIIAFLEMISDKYGLISCLAEATT